MFATPCLVIIFMLWCIYTRINPSVVLEYVKTILEQ
jgi:hypothetical protein